MGIRGHHKFKFSYVGRNSRIRAEALHFPLFSVRSSIPPRWSSSPGKRGVVMILPQVHLRKPCYDFTFL